MLTIVFSSAFLTDLPSPAPIGHFPTPVSTPKPHHIPSKTNTSDLISHPKPPTCTPNPHHNNPHPTNPTPIGSLKQPMSDDKIYFSTIKFILSSPLRQRKRKILTIFFIIAGYNNPFNIHLSYHLRLLVQAIISQQRTDSPKADHLPFYPPIPIGNMKIVTMTNVTK